MCSGSSSQPNAKVATPNFSHKLTISHSSPQATATTTAPEVHNPNQLFSIQRVLFKTFLEHFRIQFQHSYYRQYTTETMDARFELPPNGEFEKKYQRNNKKGGIKNLRCFPQCSNMEHRKGAPCTGPVVVAVKVKLTNPKNPLVAYARFRLYKPSADETFEWDLMHYHLGGDYSITELGLNIRSRANQHGREFPGEIHADVSKSGTIRAKVEFRARGWHYGWTGGRYKTDQRHYIEINFFEDLRDGSNTLRHIGVLESSTFGVFSSRRSDPSDKVKRRVKTRGRDEESDGSRLDGVSEDSGRKTKRGRKEDPEELLDDLINLENLHLPIGGGEEVYMGDMRFSNTGSDAFGEDFDYWLSDPVNAAGTAGANADQQRQSRRKSGQPDAQKSKDTAEDVQVFEPPSESEASAASRSSAEYSQVSGGPPIKPAASSSTTKKADKKKDDVGVLSRLFRSLICG
jgi:hypothetical protein